MWVREGEEVKDSSTSFLSWKAGTTINWVLRLKGRNSKFGLGQGFKVCMSARLPSREGPAIGHLSLEFRAEISTGDKHLEISLSKEPMKPRDWVKLQGE